MRTIEYTNQFKRDFKRESKGRHKKILQSGFPKIIEALASDSQDMDLFNDQLIYFSFLIRCFCLALSIPNLINLSIKS